MTATAQNPTDSSTHLVQAKLSVEGMNCASCVNHVAKAAGRVAGVRKCDVNLALGRAVVTFDPDKTNPEAVAAAISAAGYESAPAKSAQSNQQHEHDQHEGHRHDEAEAWGRRAVVGVLLWFPIEVTHWFMAAIHGQMEMPAIVWASVITSTIAIVYVGRGFYASAWKAMRHGSSNMDTLIALGASVAYGYSLIALAGNVAGVWGQPVAYYFMESSGLLALISLGHWLEARCRRAAGSAISQLMTLARATAIKMGDGGEAIDVELADIELGDLLLVRPGDRVPTDGIVVEGRGAVDESMITGEPLPATRVVGDAVIGGTLSVDGRLIVKATKIGAETALVQMVELVAAAQNAKPPVQQLADRIAAVFVPSVLGIAVITGVAWYAFGEMNHWTAGVTWAHVANAVCSVLIIACPCALGLALPAALMVGTGLGARRGILIRDLDALQHAATIGTVVLDKTGTLTEGRPSLREIVTMNGQASEEILALAAAAEQSSSHPLALAIVAAAKERGLKLPSIEEFSSVAGYGVIATIGGRKLLVGSAALLEENGWRGADGEAGSTGSPQESSVYIAEKIGGGVTPLGAVRFTDAVKTDSVAAVADLHSLGLKTLLLTGDSLATAQVVAKAVGIGDVRARVKPTEKAAVIRQLQKNSVVAMVGDGINDAPALAAADLGIAIGSGSDIAKEAGGIVLVSGSLLGVAAAIRLSRATMKTIRRNLVFAFMYNVLAIPLAAFGLLNPLIAAAAMALSDVTVIGSALLLRRCKLHR